MKVKAVWVGDKNPPANTEYGYGVEPPNNHIPPSVWSQRDKPDTNWQFQIISDDDADNISNESFYKQPAWVFQDGQGESVYTLDKSEIPDGSGALEMEVRDLYARKLKPFKEANKSFDAGQEAAQEVYGGYQDVQDFGRVAFREGENGAILVVPDSKSDFTLEGLFLLSAATGNSLLKNLVLGLTDGTYQYFELDSGSLLDMPPDGTLESWQLKNFMTSISTSGITGKRVDRAYYGLMEAHSSAKEKSELEKEKQEQESKAVLEGVQVPEVVAAPPPKRVDHNRRVVHGASAFTEDKKFSLEALDSGMLFLRHVPEAVLQEAFFGMKLSDLHTLATHLPNLCYMDTDGECCLISPPRRSFEGGTNINSKKDFEHLVFAIAKLVSTIDEAAPEFSVSGMAGDTSSVVSSGLPFELQGQSRDVVNHQLSHAVLDLLETQGYSECQRRDEFGEPFNFAKNPDAIKELTSVLQGGASGVSQASPNFVAAVKKIAAETGKTTEEVEKRLIKHLVDNLKGVGIGVAHRADGLYRSNSSAVRNTNVEQAGSLAQLSANRADMALAIASGAQAGIGSGRIPKLDKATGFRESRRGFGAAMAQLLGSDDAEQTLIGDMIYFKKDTREGPRTIGVSLARLSYLQHGLPFYQKGGKILFKRRQGKDFSFEDLSPEERAFERNDMLFRLSEIATIGTDSRGLLVGLLSKYDTSLREQEGVDTLLGIEKPITELDEDIDPTKINASLAINTLSSVVDPIANLMSEVFDAQRETQLPALLAKAKKIVNPERLQGYKNPAALVEAITTYLQQEHGSGTDGKAALALFKGRGFATLDEVITFASRPSEEDYGRDYLVSTALGAAVGYTNLGDYAQSQIDEHASQLEEQSTAILASFGVKDKAAIAVKKLLQDRLSIANQKFVGMIRSIENLKATEGEKREIEAHTQDGSRTGYYAGSFLEEVNQIMPLLEIAALHGGDISVSTPVDMGQDQLEALLFKSVTTGSSAAPVGDFLGEKAQFNVVTVTTPNGGSEYIVKEIRGSGYGDFFRLRKGKNGELDVIGYEAKVLSSGKTEADPPISQVAPALRAILTLGAKSTGIRIANTRSIMIQHKLKFRTEEGGLLGGIKIPVPGSSTWAGPSNLSSFDTPRYGIPSQAGTEKKAKIGARGQELATKVTVRNPLRGSILLNQAVGGQGVYSMQDSVGYRVIRQVPLDSEDNGENDE